MYSSTVSKTFSNNLCNPLLVFVDSFLLPSIIGPTSPILRSHLRVKSFDARVVSFTIFLNCIFIKLSYQGSCKGGAVLTLLHEKTVGYTG